MKSVESDRFRLDEAYHFFMNILHLSSTCTADFLFSKISGQSGEISVKEYYNVGQVTEFRYVIKISEGVMKKVILIGRPPTLGFTRPRGEQWII